ncbi:MAG: phosphoenolpyruvate--protein phosphotransferase [bacterium]
MFKGIPASPGVVIGEAFIINHKIGEIEKQELPSAKINEEIMLLREAVEKTKMEIFAIREKVIFEIGNAEADIFNAYIFLLEDPLFVGKAEEIVKKEKVNSAYALSVIAAQYAEIYNRISDSYLKERGRDIAGLVDKILRNLSANMDSKEQAGQNEKYIIISHDLSPADTADLDKKKVMGFVTEVGGATSHTAIVARSLEIPAVVGVRDITDNVKSGDIIIVDGEKGIVVVNPNPKVMLAYKEERRQYLIKMRMLKRLKSLDAVTLDKHKVVLNANIEFPEEVGIVNEHNVEGVGLFRTEFIYLNRMNLPSEEEQFAAYKTVAEKMNPKPATIRTLDIGGDKFLPYFKIPTEQNPFLGLRSIRLSLTNMNIFKLQLRAILRASAYGNLRIMFPMITIVEEIDEAKKILEEVKAELRSKKVPFDEEIKIGIMIEVPSAAIMSDDMSKKVDFMSIGSNDLVQYTLAVDRTNEAVSSIYDPLNPAVLRLIKMVVESAHRNGIPVSVCGEMAGEAHAAFILIGMGVDELSMSAVSVLNVKRVIRAINFKDALTVAEHCLKLNRASEIKAFVLGQLNDVMYVKK